MNSQQDQIQALLADIDEVLSKPSPRLPWMTSVETIQQRQVLERIRHYLTATRSLPVAEDSLTQKDLDRATGLLLSDPESINSNLQDADDRSVARQILQAVIGEMSYLRTNITQSLEEDVKALQQQQQALISEIKYLERQRQEQLSLAGQQANQQQIIADFLQVLMERLQETLARDIAQALANLEAQFLHNNLLILDDVQSVGKLPSVMNEDNFNRTANGELSLLTPGERLEQIRLLQAQSDRALMSLDGTMSIVFEALQSNLQSYQESLSQGLEKMHSMGQQGEAMFAALVNRLASQLGREASSYMQSSIVVNLETPNRPTADPKIHITTLPQNQPGVEEFTGRIYESPSNLGKFELDEIGEQEKLPYPGTELSPQFAQLKHDREEVRIAVTHDQSPIVEEKDDLLSVKSPNAEVLSPVMMAEDGQVENLYASVFEPEGDLTGFEPAQMVEPQFEAIAKDENLDDFFVETSNFEPAQMVEPQFEEIVADENLDDFFVETSNFEPAQMAEPQFEAIARDV